MVIMPLEETEERARASLYMDRFLAENEAFAWSLTRRVWEKGGRCCVCGDENVTIWIFDSVSQPNGRIGLIFARLFCKEHEKRWKEGEMLNYKIINGVLILNFPYQDPVDMRINMTWREFINRFVSSEGKEMVAQELIDYLTKNAHLVYKGQIKEFLERGTRAQELLNKNNL